MDTSESPDRTRGLDPRIQEMLDEVYKGADASSAKQFLDKYIWAKIWGHVMAIANCKPEMSELLHHRASIKAALVMAQDLNLEIANAKAASDRLRHLYDAKKI